MVHLLNPNHPILVLALVFTATEGLCPFQFPLILSLWEQPGESSVSPFPLGNLHPLLAGVFCSCFFRCPSPSSSKNLSINLGACVCKSCVVWEHLSSLPHQTHVCTVGISSILLSSFLSCERWNFMAAAMPLCQIWGWHYLHSSSWCHPLWVSHCCCHHLLLSILQANRTPFSHSFSVFPLGSAFPCLSDVTNSRTCPSTVSDHLTVHGALSAAPGPHDIQVTECPQTPPQPPLSTWDCLPTLTLDLLSRSNLQVGSNQHHYMSPAQAWWDSEQQLPWPCSSLSSAVCFEAGLASSAPFDPSSETFP